MLISSGWAKGARLATPAGEGTRPTAVKVRAAALNKLMPELPGAQFLDLFAGSGAMGLEAVSRGAARSVFVEQAPAALKALRTNIAEVERRAVSQGLEVPALSVLAGSLPGALAKLRGPFDVVFIDPPYKDVATLAPQLLGGLVTLTADEAVVLFESAAADAALVVAAAANIWQVYDQRAYGETMLTMLIKS